MNIAAQNPLRQFPSLLSRPVDSPRLPRQLGGVKKRTVKVGESATPYAAKKPAMAEPASPSGSTPPIRYATPEQAREAAQEVFKVHEKLFRKLAQ